MKIFLRNYYFIVLSENITLLKIANNVSKDKLKLKLIASQKQKVLNHFDRKNIKFTIINGINLDNKKVVLFDDICTTGNTFIAARNEIAKLHPKKILCICLFKKFLSI